MADSADPIIITPTLTRAGQEAAFNAKNTGLDLDLTHVTFGTAHYDPSGAELGLRAPVGNAVAIAGGSKSTPTQIRMVTAWNENVGPVAIGEIGWWAGNVLVYVWSKADGTIASYKTDGAAYVLFNDLSLAQVPGDSINIVVSADESAALAALLLHENDADPHAQYVLQANMPNAQRLLLCNVGGLVNALELTTAPGTKVTSYALGLAMRFKCEIANTGPVTVRVNDMPDMAITKAGAQPLASGDMVKGAIYDIIYDGVNFQIQGGVGGSGSGGFYARYATTSVSGQTTFPAKYTPGAEVVFVGGAYQPPSTYTATDGANVTLGSALATGTKVVVLAFNAFSVADTYSRAESDAQRKALTEQIEASSETGVSLDGADVVYPGTNNNYTITDYDKFSVLEVSSDVGTVTRSGATITLAIPSGATAKVANLSVKRGAGKARKVVIGIGASGISQPTITGPANNSTGVQLAPTIIASNFAPYPAGADTQALAEWQVATDAAFTNIVWSSSSGVNLSQVTLPDNKLATATKYYVRVRYKGNTLAAYSDWSPVVAFTTTNQYIVQPSIISPAANATGVKATPLITCSAFATFPANVNAHVSTSWRIKLNGVVVYEKLKSTSDLLSLRVPKGIFAVSKVYTVEVCHHGGTLPDSAWSAAVAFTTANYFEYGEYAYVGFATETATFMAAYGVDIDALVQIAFPNDQITTIAVVNAAQFSPDGQYLALGVSAYYQSGTAKLIILKRVEDTWSIVHNETSYESPTGFGWSADSSILAVAWLDSSSGFFYKKRTGDTFTNVNLPNVGAGYKYDMAISPDQLYIAGAIQSSSNPVVLYKKNSSGAYVIDKYLNVGNFAVDVCFSPDGKYLAIAGIGFMKVYKVSDLALANPVPVFSGAYSSRSLAFTADSKFLIAAADITRLYKISDSGVFTESTFQFASFEVATNSANNKVLFALSNSTSAVAGALGVYALANDTLTKIAAPTGFPNKGIRSLAMSPSVIGN